jgi:hypothetical protein
MASYTHSLSCILMITLGFTAALHAQASPRAIIGGVDLPDADATMVSRLRDQLRDAGYDVSVTDGQGLCDATRLNPGQCDLLVLCNAAALPFGSVAPIGEYLDAGGDLIALRTPLWQKYLVRAGDRWLPHDAFLEAEAKKLPLNTLVAFEPDDIAHWTRHSRRPGLPATYETAAEGPAPHQRALHALIPELDGWDTFGPPALKDPFPPGHTLTLFHARGGPRTQNLAIEWAEQDGSRWIATVPLTSEWRLYVLTPADFRYWQSAPGRGHSGDTFNPGHATSIRFGLAFTHTGHLGGRHEFWVGPVSTAPATPEFERYARPPHAPRFDSLTPAVQLFSCSEVASLSVRPDQVFIDSATLVVPTQILAPHPRARGAGFDKDRPWRWIPLMEARSAGGEWRGTPATLMIHARDDYAGGAWASFGVQDADWYRQEKVLTGIGQLARAMDRGLFILDGGTRFYTCFEDQAIDFGVQVANVSRRPATGLAARVSIENAGGGQTALTKTWPLDIDAGQVVRLDDTFKPAEWPDEGFLCTAELLEGNTVIDRVSHEVHVWRPTPPDRRRYITVQNGDFVLDGKRWRAHGINYMPSAGIAMPEREYFEFWLGTGPYDPEVIDRDLDHLVDIGFNSVSIFLYHFSMGSQNLLDLLRRLEARDLKANLSLRPGTPMDFQWDKMREMIEYYRLAENDTVFAYDLAWEPSLGQQKERAVWDSAWADWIVDRYGSIAAAEKDWGFAVPRAERVVTNPVSEQIDTDGPWRRMVAAYRRFADTLLYEKHGRARALVRSIDPHHLVSFRMSEAGNPTFRWDGRMPYDFPGLAGAVDILEPEAYGRIGDWESIKPGRFTFEYARWAAPHLPMIWAEMGVSAWNRSLAATTDETLSFQARYYADFYRMMIESGADGVFFWWYPGGFRYWENSDYGIINPDGTDRPVTRVIREHAERFLTGPDAGTIDTWIEIDRDKHPDGLAGIYDGAEAAFWTAIEAGRTPGLRTAGTGTDSTDCPLIAVGNVPCTGTNPPKYLDAFFDRVEVRGPDGTLHSVSDGDTLQMVRDNPPVARIKLMNLGEAAWKAGDTSRDIVKGTVYLEVSGSTPIRVPLPHDVPHLSEITLIKVPLSSRPVAAPATVTLRLNAHQYTPFGPRFTLQLRPD